VDSATTPLGLGPVTSPICKGTKRSHICKWLGDRHTGLGPRCQPWSSLNLALVSSSHRLEVVLYAQGSGGRCACPCLGRWVHWPQSNCKSWGNPWLASSPTQPQSNSSLSMRDSVWATPSVPSKVGQPTSVHWRWEILTQNIRCHLCWHACLSRDPVKGTAIQTSEAVLQIASQLWTPKYSCDSVPLSYSLAPVDSHGDPMRAYNICIPGNEPSIYP
jgi:hypothetical protein